jgi:hypothetical protein
MRDRISLGRRSKYEVDAADAMDAVSILTSSAGLDNVRKIGKFKKRRS